MGETAAGVLGNQEKQTGLPGLFSNANEDFLVNRIIEGKNYFDLEWEQKPPRQKKSAFFGGGDIFYLKEVFSFDDSLERLRKAGYERHPRPWEMFELLLDFSEDKLERDSNLYKTANDINREYSEWLSIAMERRGNTLICYTDPENIKKDKTTSHCRYFVDGELKFTDKHEFDITGIPSGEFIKLKDFSRGLIPYLYGRKFEDLPEKVQNGSIIFLPPDGVLIPISQSNDRFGLCNYYVGRCSRGVRER